MREREEKVRAQRGRVEAEMVQSRMGLDREEGEREFRCACRFLIPSMIRLALTRLCLRCFRSLLTDAIIDPQVRLQPIHEPMLTALL